MIVVKFGGTSVGNTEAVNQVARILIAKAESLSEAMYVVCSAMGGITDLLTHMSSVAASGSLDYLNDFETFKFKHTTLIRNLIGTYNDNVVSADIEQNHKSLEDLLHGIYLVQEVSPRILDHVLSFGERNSCYIINEVLNKAGISSAYLDSRKLIVTNSTFNQAKVDFVATNKNFRDYHNQHKDSLVANVVTGFIAADKSGVTTTLGRGGSDYSAAIIAAALKAEKLEIYTDVDGVLTTDPRKVKDAYTIPELSYQEAMEMSHFGAKVIYPPTILPALQQGIPIYIRNTFNPDFIGTKIAKSASTGSSPIRGISATDNISVISVQGSGMMGIPGVSARLFTTLAAANVNVILITQASSEYSITLAINKDESIRAYAAVQEAFEREIEYGRITISKSLVDKTIIAVVGEHMKSSPGIAGGIFESLGQNGINISAIAQGSTELNISFIIDKKDEDKALNLLHDSLFLSKSKKYYLFIIGTGLIGKTLLSQIDSQRDYLLEHSGIDIRIAGVANSRYMMFNREGLEISSILNELPNGDTSSVEFFISRMTELNLPNSIFIDNTANAIIPIFYEKILQKNISIVTPNKVAASSSYDRYRSLNLLAKQKNIQFLYETNVGAGLPILSTIKALNDSGDRIQKIEAVLSGSLSFIFNNYDGSTDFSLLVNQAKEKGYTEPDPREDLNGKDVMRKIVILTREAGYPVELDDVVLSSFLPESCFNVDSVEEFFIELSTQDGAMLSLLNVARENNAKLRFIAAMESGKCQVSLHQVSEESPFYGLTSSDNMVVIYTDRYCDNPLVIRGPGAGAQVTAAGVFSDVIYITKTL